VHGLNVRSQYASPARGLPEPVFRSLWPRLVAMLLDRGSGSPGDLLMAVSLNFAKRPFRDERPIVVTVGVAALLGFLLLALNVRDYYAFKASSAGSVAENARLNAEADRAEERAAHERSGLANVRLKELQIESEHLNTLLKERDFSWSLLLTRLEHALPDEVYVTRLGPTVLPNGDANLTIDLVGRGPDSIVKTLAALAKDPYFQEPVPASESDPDKGSPEGFTFHLSVRYIERGEGTS
jgi:Tfp pilus assembly protein PilN